jgi:hypothetical protein
MTPYNVFFNFSVAIWVLACSPSSKISKPPVEIKTERSSPAKADTLLYDLMRKVPHQFDTLLQAADKYRMQIIYTQIDRNGANKPQFTHHYFNTDSAGYFYPASTVKLPVAVLALQRLNELKLPGLNSNTTMITEAAFEKQTTVYNDPESADGRPTIANYIKKILLVSDNDAFNRLYEFLGQEYINRSLHKMGYDSVQLIHRLSSAMNEEQNRYTNPVRFVGSSGQTIYQKPLERSNLKYAPRKTFLGTGYMSGDKLVEQPFDFSQKNRLTLNDLHAMVQSIIFPEAVPVAKRFNLTADDYRFLHQYMSMKPSESRFPSYDKGYTDAYVKFLMYGGEGSITDTAVRIFNKVGDAYGFLTDAAYIVDFDKGVEFFLSATIYCNSDGIFNDDKYEYETIGFPFMKNLGQLIYNYEAARIKKVKPDLSRFKIDYATQN